jgi:hypothetical protein
LVELNEVNFDVAESYIKNYPHRFPALKKLITGARIRSTSEHRYEELEPWVQWVSVHTGLSYADHKIFRLGDIVGSKVPQVFEQLEEKGLRIGCVSPMNAENRLNEPAYFIPDPWTKTPSDASWWSRSLTSAVSQAVNDNAQSHISARSALYLILGMIRFAQPKHYGLYWKLISKSRGASWRKALILDLFLHDLHTRLFRAHLPEFSAFFLNAGAHIQHHYFLNSAPIKDKSTLRNPPWYASDSVDPIAEMLETYDRVVGEYLEIKDTEVIIATGLSQRPYDRVKYYYRLKDHASFLRLLGIDFEAVIPRMTRDFLIEFSSADAAREGQNRLESIRTVEDNLPLFGEINNRVTSLFVSMTYPHEISSAVSVIHGDRKFALAPHVVFVAIKNGMHQEEGFAFFTPGVAKYAPANSSHVKELHSTIMQFFASVGKDT